MIIFVILYSNSLFLFILWYCFYMNNRPSLKNYIFNQIDKNIDSKNYLVIILLFGCMAIYLTTDLDNTLYSVENIHFQIITLTLISFMLSIIFLLSSNPFLIFIVFIVNTMLVLLISGMHVNSVGFRFWIITSLFFQYSVKFSLRLSLPLCIILCIGFIPIQANREVFGFTFNGINTAEFGFLCMSEFVVIIILHFQKYIIKKNQYFSQEIGVRDKTIHRLTDTNLKFQNFAFAIEHASKLEERLNITREIHDITGYTLTSITMMLEYGEDLLLSNEREKLLEVLSSARNQARNGHSEIREALIQLRKIQDAPEPLSKRVYKIVHNFMHVTGMDIQLEFTNFNDYESSGYDNFILRFLQEGLTNSYRHGKATKVNIIFFQEYDNLLISIEDNGIGSSSIVEGIGLKGMSERVSQQGGVISYKSSLWGFSLQARLPISEYKIRKHNGYKEN